MKLTHLLLLAFAFSASAQSVKFDEDELKRGYYDRPWQKYEAEPGKCVTNAEFLLPAEEYSQQPLQAEASNQLAVILKDSNDYIEWIIDTPGRGITIRFSLPDSEDGKGRKGTLLLDIDGKKCHTIDIDSKWAWQYTGISYSPEKYPDNMPGADKFARMRFDETYFLLDTDIPSGSRVRLSKNEDDDMDYCIDFIEIEPVAPALEFDQIETDDKVMFDGSTSLGSFISSHSGKTIFIPEGTYDIGRQLTITGENTKLIGAGMWYTHLYFSTPSDDRSTYNARGIHCNVSGVTLQGMSLNTANDKRYYANNPSYQVGKGLNGSWGVGSTIKDVRIDHFECGAWISGAKNLNIEQCRFRNNYADGINLAGNSSGCRVSHCSFRNNGDDDMASWSTGSYATDNEYSYCTAENNWRASSLGFFGGCRGIAHHIAIYDAMEAGVRVVCDFDGTGFSTEGFFELSDIAIHRCGAKQGPCGTQGGFWGDSAASLQIGAGWAYDLNNINIHDIDIFDSRHDAISIKANSGKTISNLMLHHINIIGVEGYAYGIQIDPAVRGRGSYGDIYAEGVVEPWMSDIPTGFNFEDMAGVANVYLDPIDKTGYFNLEGLKVESRNKQGVVIVNKGKDSYMILNR